MAYDEAVVERLRRLFAGRTDVTEKKMFGGIAFMVSGHMCCGVLDQMLVARVGPAQHAAALRKPHTRPMDFTGRPLTGLVYVAPPGYRGQRELRSWVKQCESFIGTLPPRTAQRRQGVRRPIPVKTRTRRASRRT